MARLLHLHSDFAAERSHRTVALINAFGRGLEHTIISVESGGQDVTSGVAKGITVTRQPDFPNLEAMPLPGRLMKIARAMKPFDLVLTYNWATMNAVMAHTMFSQALDLPPLIHHEDGLDENELRRPKRRRTWYRRVALGKASGLVVPSEMLEEIALVGWQQPLGRVKHIPTGIDTKAFAMRPKPDSFRLIKRKGEKWIGTLGDLRVSRNLPDLVRAIALLDEDWHLVILGEGSERAAIETEADRLGLNHRVHLPGMVKDPSRIIGLFDIFASSGDAGHCPISVIQAMAAGLPVVSPVIGDIAGIVAEENRAFLGIDENEADFSANLHRMAHDAACRKRIGAANQVKAQAEFDLKRMIATYRRLYSSAMRQNF